KKKTEEAEKLERQQAGGIEAGKTLINNQVVTPAPIVEETQKSAARKALEQEAVMTGDIFVDAFQIFANTFAQRYLRRIQQGLLTPRSSRTPGGLLTGIEGSPASRAALLAEYSAFSPQSALNLGTPGEIDLFADMSSCPPNEYQNPYNCLLSDNFQQAVRQEMTVAQAVEAGLIDRNMLFPEDPEPQEARLSEQNLKKLRFLRVIPIGWELAANISSTKKVRFSELLRCFDDSSEDCADLNHLVDPQWVLALPQQYCRAQGYSSITEHEKSPNRQKICVDLQSCIQEDSSGKCLEYGYCARERSIWELPGRSCDPQFVTCQTFAKPDNTKISLLASSIDKTGCTSQASAGCNQYSTYKDPGLDNTWDADQSIFLNNKSLSCSSQDSGTQEVIVLATGVNIIKNGDFKPELIMAGNDAGEIQGGWKFSDLDLEYVDEGQYVKPVGDVWQMVLLKPYTYYTL
ncbi:MAG: hypothetical protein COV79_04165, partial [Parcubacteria group bacterium CG11_big_fil_rev_8_21_14_0_20_41_14]